MASAQVLPVSRKQEHLEAGKRRLEEFRKKKAAERAKKAATSNLSNTSDVSINEKDQLETEHERAQSSAGAGTSSGSYSSSVKSNPSNQVNAFAQGSLKVSPHEMYGLPHVSGVNLNSSSTEVNAIEKGHEMSNGITLANGLSDVNSAPDTKSTFNDFKEFANTHETLPYGNISNHLSTLHVQASQDYNSISSQSDFHRKDEVRFRENDNSLKASTIGNGVSSQEFPTGISSQSSLQSQPANAVLLGSSRRSHPSFFDSLDVSTTSSRSPFLFNEQREKSFISGSTMYNGNDVLQSYASQKSSVAPPSTGILSELSPTYVSSVNDQSGSLASLASNGDALLNAYDKNMEKHEFHSIKQNEDFAALEQHIEDLTQEKFSLQRALETSHTLAESLAAENSSLTDSYNQQRSVVNQLKAEMEKLQEEIKAQLRELESFKMECINARLECSAADERGIILASEVIGLEEKALRLRSNELNLEGQLENAEAEISSYKEKMSSLEKDQLDLQFTVDALREEKKVLQSKLQKASSGGQHFYATLSTVSRKDMSTSTEDLDSTSTSSPETHIVSSFIGNDSSSLPLLPRIEASSLNIPLDQMRTVQNIDGLISELAMEKQELMQALTSELSQSNKLKELNKELSRKLEAQTQRLELLTAQSMVNEHTSLRQPNANAAHENAAYADEGDEVVERVLGWIMKLFPGGPSRRRTSKLL